MAATREFSAGGVIYRTVEATPDQPAHHEIAVIKPRGKKALALPKGHIDQGEKAPEAAEREVREETGLEGTLVSKLGDVKYVYKWEGKPIFKVVSFFLFAWRSGTIDQLDEKMRIEVDQARWLELSLAQKQLSYPGEREMVKKAIAVLSPKPVEPVPGEGSPPSAES